MHSLLATTVLDQDSFGSFLGVLVQDFVPVFTLAAGSMAVIWIACAAIVATGYLIGTLVVLGLRALVHACARYVRRRRGAEYAQLVTVDADGAHTKVVNLDGYRRRRQHCSDHPQPHNTFQSRYDDDPA